MGLCLKSAKEIAAATGLSVHAGTGKPSLQDVYVRCKGVCHVTYYAIDL